MHFLSTSFFQLFIVQPLSLSHLGLMQVINVKFFSKEHEANMLKIAEQTFFSLNIA
jgi:hypothetical protein